MKRILIVLTAILAFAGVAYAHNGVEHVMGTVTAITATNVTVKTTDGKTQTVALTATTKVSKGTAQANLKDVKVGDHVVVNATKKDNQLVAVEVKLGSMDGMKGMHGNMGGMDMSGASKSH